MKKLETSLLDFKSKSLSLLMNFQVIAKQVNFNPNQRNPSFYQNSEEVRRKGRKWKNQETNKKQI